MTDENPIIIAVLVRAVHKRDEIIRILREQHKTLKAELKIQSQAATQRGARMQLMRQFAYRYPEDWGELLEFCPDADSWFDYHGAPVSIKAMGQGPKI